MGTKRAGKYLITLSAAAAVDHFMHSNFWIKINNSKWDQSYDNLILHYSFIKSTNSAATAVVLSVLSSLIQNLSWDSVHLRLREAHKTKRAPSI